MRTNTNTHRTLTHLITAHGHRRPVTITTTKQNGTTTVRTIEITDITTTAAGHIVIRAHDRDRDDQRTFRLDRITHYTAHRTTYTHTPNHAPRPQVRSTAALIARELGRDYHPACAAYATAA